MGVALVLIYPCGKAQKQPPRSGAESTETELWKWREIGPNLRELWQRPAGPMNWKNPIRVFAVLGWLVVQGFVLLGWTVLRAGQFVVALPALVLFFFRRCVVRRVELCTASLSRRLMSTRSLLWCNTTPPISSRSWCCGTTFRPSLPSCCAGLFPSPFGRSGSRGRRRDFAPFAKLPPWPLSADQKTPAIVIGEVHHPVEAREIFSPSWLTIPERGLYTGVAIFGAVGSGKTSACMNPFARQLLGWQAGNPHLRAAALVLEVKGDFCHDHPPNSGRGGPWTRLHRDWHGLPLSMESALGLVARFVLAGLHRFELAQSVVRQGQGTLLAASLYQSGPLDHRASPRVPGPLGDVATGLPLRHRPGAIRGQDRGGGEAE